MNREEVLDRLRQVVAEPPKRWAWRLRKIASAALILAFLLTATCTTVVGLSVGLIWLVAHEKTGAAWTTCGIGFAAGLGLAWSPVLVLCLVHLRSTVDGVQSNIRTIRLALIGRDDDWEKSRERLKAVEQLPARDPRLTEYHRFTSYLNRIGRQPAFAARLGLNDARLDAAADELARELGVDLNGSIDCFVDDSVDRSVDRSWDV
jgi:hypothetical protein